jgi:hypothetical protein
MTVVYVVTMLSRAIPADTAPYPRLLAATAFPSWIGPEWQIRPEDLQCAAMPARASSSACRTIALMIPLFHR